MQRLHSPAIAAALMCAAALANAAGFELGGLVLANYQGGPYAYVARITTISGREIGVKYLDDASEETRDRSEVRSFDWKIGTKLECAWKHGTVYYPGTVARIGERELHFNYDDGDKEATAIAVCRQRVSGSARADATSNAGNPGSGGNASSDAPCPGPGLTRRCQGICVNIQSDNNNCGGCGNVCPSGKTCDGHMFCRDAQGNL